MSNNFVDKFGENESESLCEARLAADVERVIVTRKNESESLREARLAADV